MDWEVVAGIIFIVLVVVLVGSIVTSLVMDGSSNAECTVLGYDSGGQLFFRGITVCRIEVKPYAPAEYEYFILPRE